MKQTTKSSIKRGIISFLILVVLFLAIYLPLYFTGVWDQFDSAQNLKIWINKWGAFSYLVFGLIQFLQVTFIPLPAIITTTAGVWIFGPWTAMWISYIAVIAGSVAAFYLGRWLGRKLVVWIAGDEKEVEKWEQKLKKGKYTYFLMMLFPFFPDDILCYIVGTTKMTFRFFITVNLTARFFSIGLTCLVVSGDIVPYSGWGIPVWIIIIVLMLGLIFVSFKYEDKIEHFAETLIEKLKKIWKKNENN